MITVHSLCKTYAVGARRGNGVAALRNVSFSAPDGKVTALLGPNGAGKTTALRIITGLERQDQGSVHMSLKGGMPFQSNFGMFTESCGLYGRLTGHENIAYYGRLHGLQPERLEQRLRTLTDVLDLGKLLHRRAETYSQGERMRVALARAIVHEPHHVILDEPTNGLDLASVRRLRELLKFLASPSGGGHCVLFSSHVMSEVEKLADSVIVIAGGQVKATGSVAEIVLKTRSADLEEAFYRLVCEDAA